MKLHQNVLRGTVIGVALGTANIVIAVISAGAGHGTYTAAKILFPYTMYLAEAFAGSITGQLMLLAVLQFPLYGFVLGWAAARGRMKIAIYSILFLHAVAWVLCL
jgi:hypothetical protein